MCVKVNIWSHVTPKWVWNPKNFVAHNCPTRFFLRKENPGEVLDAKHSMLLLVLACVILHDQIMLHNKVHCPFLFTEWGARPWHLQQFVTCTLSPSEVHYTPTKHFWGCWFQTIQHIPASCNRSALSSILWSTLPHQSMVLHQISNEYLYGYDDRSTVFPS